ncbi:MAG: serine/threonine protein kinase [Candidatus Marsarchaeota archaeon]|nr:serine/threonine protein kinase [Candidatus Marsarchaeota archaeon]
MDEKRQNPIPKTIGRFHIDGLYAQGGMSTLFLATDPTTHDQIIVKVLLPKFLDDPNLVQRFLTEGRIIAMTDHPNIVKLYEYGEWEGGVFIAMELIKGVSLRKILQHNPLPLKKALEVLLQVCYAIGHLHTHGVIHGDLKPENILVTDQNQVKIIDFGIAKVLAEPSSKHERFAGTPIYMSPEARENPRNASVQSDIYSIAIVAYELVMGKITHGKVILTLAPRGLQSILQKALQPNPQDRYTDIFELIHDIAEYIHSGELQKDRQGADYFFELFSQVEMEQKNLLQSLIVAAPPYVGITLSYGVGLNALYFQVVTWHEITLVFLAEGIHKGVQGVIDTFRLHTIFEAMKPACDDPLILLTRVTEEMQRQNLSFRHASLTLNHATHRYLWHHEGWGALFLTFDSTTRLITPPPPAASANYLEGSFDPSYQCTLLGCTSPTLLQFPSHPLAPLDVVVSETIQATHSLPPEKQTSNILQKLRLRGDCIVDDHPVCIIVVAPRLQEEASDV